ncbi:hypothetical protein ACR77V_12340, partial [Staphylococcus epidermidis]|uniref:hypothetical protein n=1 Tax=Staphylococcus epidermidis TaxID=1282 RepID=UPI003DA502DC
PNEFTNVNFATLNTGKTSQSSHLWFTISIHGACAKCKQSQMLAARCTISASTMIASMQSPNSFNPFLSLGLT